MTERLGWIGISSGIALVALLATNIWIRRFDIWPTPKPWSWQSITFWTLFRSLNLSALSLAALDWKPLDAAGGLRILAAFIALAWGAAYVSACFRLGRANLYCGKAGLACDGIYGWTRNPQYAAAIPAYTSLAIAAQSAPLAILVALLVTVFYLMAVGEEPWLEAAYGDAYARYKAKVPRFYNFQRVLRLQKHAPSG